MEVELPSILDGEDKESALKNCIRNNYRHVRKWAKRAVCNAFRLYDREIAHYPLAIDFYAGRYCIHYFSPDRDNDEPPSQLCEDVAQILGALFGAKREEIFWRTRIKREKKEQYEKVGASQDFFVAVEYGVKFWINLVDYLDTGLFLDHRETRRMVAQNAKGKRLLNLFSYTGAFSVQAAVAGALTTKSVDMSNTYSNWCVENFHLNGLSLKNNEVVRADCLKFLEEEVRTPHRYDLIVIDPPTLSRSKKMDQMFDIQKDYPDLIAKGLLLLKEGGSLFFSTNSRKFSFDETLFQGCSIRDISRKTIPIDFHNQRIHKAWILTKGA